MDTKVEGNRCTYVYTHDVYLKYLLYMCMYMNVCKSYVCLKVSWFLNHPISKQYVFITVLSIVIKFAGYR